MSNHEMVTIRVNSEFKAQLLVKARRRNKTVSKYLKDLVDADKEVDMSEPIPLTEEERIVLERFVGMYGKRSRKKGRVPLTNEEIDRVVYGEH